MLVYTLLYLLITMLCYIIDNDKDFDAIGLTLWLFWPVMLLFRGVAWVVKRYEK